MQSWSLTRATTMLLALAAQQSYAETVRLRVRDIAVVTGRPATLADVLAIESAPADVAELATSVSLELPAAPLSETITHETIMHKLRAAGVNPGNVLLGGAAHCRLTLAVEAEVEAAPDEAAGPTAAPSAPSAAEGGATLADLLRERITESLRKLNGEVEVEFERSAGDALSLTSPPFEFAIRGSEGQKLGLREFSVAVRRDGKTQRTLRIAAHVRLIKRVLVARRALNQGTQLREDALEFAPRLFAEDGSLGVEFLEQAVGQRVKRFLPAGAMIQPSDLDAMDLVQRSRPVTITGGENVSLRLTGVALDRGRYGDTIRVRLGDSRKNQREARGVVTGFASVRLVEETP